MRIRFKQAFRISRVTLVLLPDSGRAIRGLSLPGFLLTFLAVAVAGIVAGSALLLDAHLKAQASLNALQDVMAVNSQLSLEIAGLKAESETLRQRVVEVEQLERQVRSLVGLNERGPRPSLAARSESPPLHRQRAQLGEIESNLHSVAQSLPEEKLRLSGLVAYLDALPSLWPARGPISSPFGNRRSPFGGGQQFHEGIDIAADYGVVVVASGSGKVATAGWDAGLGRVVEIDHGYGFGSMYCHNSELLVKEGETVKKGQPIARVGSSGLSTGPHLHFAIKFQGEYKDPLSFLMTH